MNLPRCYEHDRLDGVLVAVHAAVDSTQYILSRDLNEQKPAKKVLNYIYGQRLYTGVLATD